MTDFLAALNPGFVLILAGLLALVAPMRPLRQALALAAPALGILLLWSAERGVDLATLSALGLDLVLYRVDGLGFVFGLAFLIAALLHAIYALHQNDRLQDGMALCFAGAAVAAVFAGDLMTLFIFWELTAIAGVFLILRAGTLAAYRSSLRFLVVQILSGVLFLDGLVYVYKKTGALDFTTFTSLEQPGAIFVLIAVGVKAAFPLLHAWLQDAFPKATITGAVVLAAVTTQLGVYALARIFPGLETLIWIGAATAVFPIFFMVIENDLRRVLAYALNSQVGFMICAVGVGTPLALNGAAAHAFALVVGASLLFMSMGAVLYRTGSTRASDLGGLHRSMPWTALFCIAGAASISAVPLFAGFAAQSMTLSVVAEDGRFWISGALLFATAGVLAYAGIKVPYAAFFAENRAPRVAEAPANMLVAMGAAAALCLFLGLPPLVGGYGALYALTPYPDAAAAHEPFAAGRVLAQLQLLTAGAAAFALLTRLALVPSPTRGEVLDVDWLYRGPLRALFNGFLAAVAATADAVANGVGRLGARLGKRLVALFSPYGDLARAGLVNGMAMWSGVLLGVVALIEMLAR